MTATEIAHAYVSAFNDADLGAFDALLADDYVNHSPGWPDLPTDRDGVKAVVERMHDTFADLAFVVEDVLAAPDGFAMRSRMTGRHRESGRAVDVGVLQIERLRDGRITDHWRITDDAALARQLAA